MNELGIFSGAGGFALAGKLLGWRSIGYVDNDEFCCDTVGRRIDDGCYDAAPVFCCDVRDFVRFGFAQHYRGMAQVVTAGFPCQPFSSAGKMLGENDPRNMWPATIECVRIVRPEWVFLENVAAIRHPKRQEKKVRAPSYLGRVFFDLAESGFDLAWGCLRASDLGAPHKRDRIWIVAHAHGGCVQQPVEAVCPGRSEPVVCGATVPDAQSVGQQGGLQGRLGERHADGLRAEVPHADGGGRHAGDESAGRQEGADAGRSGTRAALDLCDAAGVGLDPWIVEPSEALASYAAALRAGWWAAEPGIRRVANGLADQHHRLRALGQGLVPAVAAAAWKLLSARLMGV